MKRNTAALAWTFAALLVVSPLAAMAAPKDPSAVHGPAAKAIEVIQKAADNDNVKLDAEQKTKVHAVIEDAMAQAQAMQDERKASKGDTKDKGDRQAAHEKVIELAQNTVTKVEAVLTDEQKTAFRTALKEERAKLREERGNGGANAGNGHGNAGDKPAK